MVNTRSDAHGPCLVDTVLYSLLACFNKRLRLSSEFGNRPLPGSRRDLRRTEKGTDGVHDRHERGSSQSF